MVLFVLVAFLVYIVFMAYNFYSVSNSASTVSQQVGTQVKKQVMFSDNMGIAADNNVFFVLAWFGTIIGIIIGCSTISSERMGGALNTLVVKPLYRDTIINGKVLGSLAFLACLIIFLILFYTSALFILCGNLVAPHFLDYFERLPFMFLFIMVFAMVFLSLSMLISLLVNDQAFAMILGTLTVYISLNFSSTVSSNLNNILPGSGLGNMLEGFSPYSLMWNGGVQNRFMNTSLGAFDAFMNIFPDFVKLLLFVVVVMALNYIVFVRRDIA